MSGEKQKLTITRCEVTQDGQTNPSSSQDDIFEALLNPASYTQQLSIAYSKEADPDAQCGNQKPQGQMAVESRFASINAEKVSFELVLDGTGVVKKDDSSVPDVKAEIETLKDIVYRYVGDKHEPSVVKLSWGELHPFYGRMESMSVDFTLFKPSGLPLRARVKLSFVSFMTQVEAALRANRSSPDLSHLVEVRDGDTLPLLCQRIYNDCSRYLEVARENKLANFRRLEPGTWLRFPPLR
jgi:nucleoid-associated protein YgaU